MFTDLQAIVLAAGKSSRINTGNTKLLEKMCGQELILYPTTLLEQLRIPTTLVVGYQKDLVIKTVQERHTNEIAFVEQIEQLGTGHALRITQPAWEKDHILVLNADVPLINQELIERLYQAHCEQGAAVSIVTAHNGEPLGTSYGRVIKHEGATQIVEARELSRDELQEYCIINAGIYIFSRDFLELAITTLSPNQVSSEVHITDLVRVAQTYDKIVATISVPFDCVRGINTFQELWAVEHIKRAELIRHWMERGVRFLVPQSILIDLHVKLGKGTTIGCGVHLLGETEIGENCFVSALSSLSNSVLHNYVTIHPHCVIQDAHIKSHAEVGPFAYLRSNALLEQHSKVGCFVEVKESVIGEYSQAKHLTYLGDAEVGSHVNIGAGTITCNYDGFKKHRTVIEDDAQIGSNNSLVAPVCIERSAYTAAGSVITSTVPKNALGIARARQVNKPYYAQKLRERHQNHEPTEQPIQAPAEEESNFDQDQNFSFIGAIKGESETGHEDA